MTQARATLLGVGLIAAATLVFELALTRVFAVAQFYHFAFMAVSLALLGAGASGSILTAWRRRIAPIWLALAFALTLPGAYLLINTLPFDSYSIAWDPTQAVLLVVYFLSLALPFTVAGLITGALLERGPVHGIYGANLAGSALGALLTLPGLELLPAEGLIIGAAALGLGGTLAFTQPNITHSDSGLKPTIYRRIRLPLLILLVLAVVGTIAPPSFLAVTLSPYKALTQVLRAPDARHTFSRWSALARVDVVESSAIHTLPGLSMAALQTPPPQVGITLDGDNLMPISALPVSEAAPITDYLPEALAYVLRPGARALVLEPGGGLGVLQTLAGGAESVVAVEPNPHVIGVVRDLYDEFTAGLYADPRLTLVNQAGRAFLRGSGETFDVIAFPLTDTFRPVTSGAYSLSEDYRYTVEAFGEALDRLAPDGLIVVTRWAQMPPSEDARLFATLIAALRARGVDDPGAQIVVYRSLQTSTFLVRQAPFPPDELAAIRSWLESRRYDLSWSPDITPDDLNRFNRLPEESYHALYAALLDDADAVIARYDYDIRPTTDDWPFFFHYFRWAQTPTILATLGLTWQPFGGSGFFVLVALLALVGVASVVLIVGPLLLPSARREAQSAPVGWRLRARTLAYFLLLGLGFLWIELPLAQRFILFLGHPTLALGVVLASILLFSGIGSALSSGWPLRRMLLALVGVIALYPLVIIPALFEAGIGWPIFWRALATGVALAPLGVLMGVPFAGGLKRLQMHAASLTPWAWAINGCASVVSSVLAVMLALSFSLSAVLGLGALAYLGAALAAPILGEKSILPHRSGR